MRLLLAVSFLTVLVLVSGCTTPGQSTSKTIGGTEGIQLPSSTSPSAPASGSTVEEGDSGIVCNSPYIRFGTGCCLDRDVNSICDSDEPESKPSCPFECCEEGQYKQRQCSVTQDCINSECVKKICPYECCVGTAYQDKSCTNQYECINARCEAIPVPKLSLSIDGCKTSFNIVEQKGEVTDVLATVTNYGTKEALNVQLSSTATDEDSIYSRSRGSIGVLAPGESQPFKLTVDTKQGVQSTISLTAICSDCSPPTITSSSSQCFVDWENIVDKAKYIAAFVGI